MHLRNFTPHPLTVIGVCENLPSEGLARVDVESIPIESAMPLVWQRYGTVTGLPEPDGSLFVVSAVTAHAAWAQGRTDVAHPGNLVRDADGRVIGAKTLVVTEPRPPNAQSQNPKQSRVVDSIASKTH